MSTRFHDVRWIGLLAVTALALYLAWTMLKPFVGILLWASALVVAFYPVHRRLVERIHWPAAAALLSTLLVLLVVILPLSFVSTLLIREAAQAAHSVQAAVQDLAANPAWGERIRQVRDTVEQHVRLDDVLARLNNVLLQGTVSIVGTAVQAIASVFFTVVTMFFLFRDAPDMVRRLPQFIPIEPPKNTILLNRAREIMEASIYGVLAIALVQGTLGGVMFAVLGLSSAVLWGVVMILLAMIPMVGTGLVWGPAAAYLALSGHWGKAAVLVIWGIGVIGVVDNILRPRLVGQRARMSELLVFLSVLGGLRAFGFIGILLGPVIMALTVVLLETLLDIGRGDEGTGPTASHAA